VSTLQVGSYVTHAKLPDLGSGEILAMEKGAIRIRFVSGERSFDGGLAAAFLETTLEIPIFPKKRTSKRASKAAPKRPAARPPTASLSSAPGTEPTVDED
jgi:hypothetical protein